MTTISYGGGLEGGRRLVRSSETGDAVEQFQFAPRGFFQISRRNLFGKDRSLDLFTRVSFRPKGVSATPTTPITGATVDEGGYGFNEYVARLTFLERRILGTDADATISAGVEQAVRSSFDFNRRGASATITRRLSPTLAVSGRYGIDHTKLLNIKSNFAAQPEIDRLFPQVRLSSVASSLIRDTRNDPIEPNSGSLIGVDAELAARRIGSEVGFFKTFVQGFTYRQLDATELGRSRIRRAPGAGDGLSARGDQRGRDDHPGRPAGERALLCRRRHDRPRIHARSARHTRDHRPGRLSDRWPGADRAERRDAHSASRRSWRGRASSMAATSGGLVSDMDFSQMRGAVGFGMRYRSPVGPIRVDLGFKLDRQVLPTGERERPTALHISLGQAF